MAPKCGCALYHLGNFAKTAVQPHSRIVTHHLCVSHPGVNRNLAVPVDTQSTATFKRPRASPTWMWHLFPGELTEMQTPVLWVRLVLELCVSCKSPSDLTLLVLMSQAQPHRKSLLAQTIQRAFTFPSMHCVGSLILKPHQDANLPARPSQGLLFPLKLKWFWLFWWSFQYPALQLGRHLGWHSSLPSQELASTFAFQGSGADLPGLKVNSYNPGALSNGKLLCMSLGSYKSEVNMCVGWVLSKDWDGKTCFRPLSWTCAFYIFFSVSMSIYIC